MSLGLDLRASEAKVARARIHCDSLKSEVIKALDERPPYGVRADVDEQTGWWRVYLVFHEKDPEYPLSLIAGDIVHNLRSALDYIVTALVAASGAQLMRKHQFPIFHDRVAYERKVGDQTQAVVDGMLGGVTVGLNEVWQVQPFQRQDPEMDPLFVLNYFSNSDKHRMLTENWVDIEGFTLEGRVIPEQAAVESVQLTPDIEVIPKTEYELQRVRYGEPPPEEVSFKIKAHDMKALFGALPLIATDQGHAFRGERFLQLCEVIARVVEVFKRL